jgi:aspartate kinase
MLVLKFGGASVKDADAVKNVAAIMQLFLHEKTIVVISAMGKITNLIEKLTLAYYNNTPEQLNLLDELKQFHFNICSQLFPEQYHPIFLKLHNTITELEWALEDTSFNYNQYYDQCVCFGELISTTIVSEYLNQQNIINNWLDVREIIKTDDAYREGKVNWENTETLCNKVVSTLFAKSNTIITQGFIGCTAENYTTTLGREGSDYTAAILAYSLNAKSVTIWKDVPGVLDADPKKFENTKIIHQLSYLDTIELAFYGATVIHPKTIKPLQNKDIPLYVKSFINPSAQGTIVSNDGALEHVPSYISKSNQALISIFPKDFSFIVEDNLSSIFALFAKYRVKINVMQNSAISFSVCIDNNENKIQEILPILQQQYKVLFNDNLELLTIRYYNTKIVDTLTANRSVILEQKSRHTCQFVLK